MPRMTLNEDSTGCSLGGAATVYAVGCTLLVFTTDVAFVISPVGVALLTSATNMTLILSMLKDVLMKPVA